MGARALVAYERRPGEYELHYSHWGANEFRLLREITPDTPYADGAVDADPWEETHAASLREILDVHLQYGVWEAFYIVEDDWTIRPFALLEYEQGRGACLPVRTYDDGGQTYAAHSGRDLGHVEGLQAAAVDLHEDREAAIEWLHQQVRSRYLGSTGRAASYDVPLLSTEDSIPPQFQPSAQSLSELMTDGGTAQPTLSDF